MSVSWVEVRAYAASPPNTHARCSRSMLGSAMKKFLVAATTTAALLATAVPAAAITNGVTDTDHDFVGVMRGADPGGTERQCSGSLIAEGVFLTAGHCAVLTGVTVHFGADLDDPDASVREATEVVRHPSYAANFGRQYDVAVVLFGGSGLGIVPGELAAENMIDTFSKDELRAATFEAVGYGLVRNDANGNSAPLVESSQRMIATQSYLNMHNQYLGLSIHTHKGNGGGCFGDSGGPHLLHDVIVSITSNGDGNCVATDNTQRVDQPEIRDWIQGFIDVAG